MSQQKVNILSICGGGVRGIIPAYILRELESRLQAKLADTDARIVNHLDFVAGTSAGGLLTALLLSPDSSNSGPRYSAAEVFDRFMEIIKEIYYLAPSGIPAPNPEYSSEKSIEIYDQEFEQLELKDTIKHCMLTAYEPNRHWMAFLKQHRAKVNPHDNFLLKDVVLSTCALPVYAEPVKTRSFSDRKVTTHSFLNHVESDEKIIAEIWQALVDKHIIEADGNILMDLKPNGDDSVLAFPNHLKKYQPIVYRIIERAANPEFLFLDGCVFSNNPSMCSLIEVKKMNFPDKGIMTPRVENTNLISLGTGINQMSEAYNPNIDGTFATRFITMLFESAEDLVNFQCYYLYGSQNITDQFHSFDPILKTVEGSKYPTNILIDISDDNLHALLKIAEVYVAETSERLDRVIESIL